jgi:hypothetical protein
VTVYHVEPIPRSLMAAFVAAYHYPVRVPPHRLLSLGCFNGGDAEETPERAAPGRVAEVG